MTWVQFVCLVGGRFSIMGTLSGGQNLDNFQQNGQSRSDTIGQSALDRLFRRIIHPDGLETDLAPKPKRTDIIERAIKLLVIPKLAVMNSQEPQEMADTPRACIVSSDEVKRFLQLVLASDTQACVNFVESLAAQGHSLAHICIDLLTPVARDLGVMWEDDTASFVDVTTGLGLLHTLLYRLGGIFRTSGSMIDPSRRILLASLNGEQHNFGLQMVAELFRQANWEVTVEPSIGEADLVQLVRETSFAIVGLSLADTSQTSQLGNAIRELRKISANETIGVIVGGPVFVMQPDLASLIGADLTAHDAEQAVFRAEGLRVLLANGT